MESPPVTTDSSATSSSPAPLEVVEVLTTSTAIVGEVAASAGSDLQITGDWSSVRQYANAARQFSRAQVACQVLAGLELLALRKAHNITNGKRPDLPAGPTWADLVAEHAGISDETARRWCLMAHAIRPRLKKLPGVGALFRELLLRPIGELTQDQQLLLEQAVHKATDGYTQTEFMRELGLAKGHGAGKGGDLGGRRPKKTLPTEEELLAMSRDDFRRISEIMQAADANFTLLPDSEIHAQIAILTSQIQARRQWLDTPAAKRDQALLKTVTKTVRGQ